MAGGASDEASPPKGPEKIAPDDTAEKLGVVGDVMISFSSSSTTLIMLFDVGCSLSPPNGLEFAPKGLEKEPAMVRS